MYDDWNNVLYKPVYLPYNTKMFIFLILYQSEKLLTAVWNGDMNGVKLALENGANVESSNEVIDLLMNDSVNINFRMR